MYNDSEAIAPPIMNETKTNPLREFPPELDKFNWGAFLLNWTWGIGNRTYIAFLCFVPFLNIIWPFVLGFKGSRWAWENDEWKSIDHFKSVQRKWAIAGILVMGGCILLTLLFALPFILVFAFLAGDSDDSAMATRVYQQSAICEEYTGNPIETGWALGNTSLNAGGGGTAEKSFSVSGPKGEGTVYYEATREMGQWQITRIRFQDDKTGKFHELDPAKVNETYYTTDRPKE